MKHPITILVDTNRCSKCNIELMHGREVLNLVKNREKCWSVFDIDPNLTEKDMLKCPKCKIDYLIYEKYWRAD
ncbi:MAG: hypothetical protein ACTSR8_17105 [Promethearchaeota archaeon]